MKIYIYFLILFSYCSIFEDNQSYYVNHLKGTVLTTLDSENSLWVPPLTELKISKSESIQMALSKVITVSYNNIEYYAYSNQIGLQSTYTAYVNDIYGTEFRELNKVTQKLKFKEQVKVIRINADSLSVLEVSRADVEWNGRKGEIDWSNLSLDLPKRFFLVITPSGLNIRDTPDLKGKIIQTLPYRTKGELLEANRKNEFIQNKEGFWFKTKVNNISGWIFSGFVLFSDKNDFYKNEEWFNNFLEEVNPVEGSNNETLYKQLETKFVIRKELTNYTVYQLNIKDEKNCYGIETNKIFIKLKKSNHIIQAIKSNCDREVLLDNELPIEDSILVKVQHCCGDLPPEKLIYIAIHDKLYPLTFGWENSDAFCFYHSGNNFSFFEYYTLHKEVRFHEPTKTIFIHRKLPICTETIRTNVEKLKPTDFQSELFVVLKIKDTELKVDRIFSPGIPKIYQSSWNESTKVEKKENE